MPIWMQVAFEETDALHLKMLAFLTSRVFLVMGIKDRVKW